MKSQNKEWLTIIKPKKGYLNVNLKEIWQYKDLILLLFKRNFTTRYKQTILGPIWYIIYPIINTLISTLVFGTIAKIPSDGVPYFLFYMCGHTAWNYFSSCLVSTSSTFTNNAHVFGKVYFPRLASPISTVLTELINFGIQLLIMVAFLIYYIFMGADVTPNLYILLLPVLVIQMAALGLGFGIIISSLTTKYRDLTVVVSFGVTLLMYVTPIIYSTASIPEKLKPIIMLNPMSSVVEIMRYSFLGTGEFPLGYWSLSLLATVVILSMGVIIFNRVEKTFMDTV